ncbi:tetratricopeptide repeat protein 36 homolog [Tachypleus tridentatus]|uniref:tetratricopeptide repeat protein 36 homolog n=1 Tax=Tachypleus tridentatus TaxID=6853 RepID=UPI003FD30DD2
MGSRHDRAVLNSIFNPSLPVGECVFDDEIPTDLRDEEDGSLEVQEAKQLEIEGVKAAEEGQLEKAIQIFTKAIELTPRRASGFNNRAQVLRLKGDNEGAVLDLNNAINMSEGKGKAACQAYCQRALLHCLHKDDELALEDFKRAAALGSEFAKAQVVRMNPYAALCNQMLSRVMDNLQKGDIQN